MKRLSGERRRGPHKGLMQTLKTSVFDDLRSRSEDDLVVAPAAYWALAGRL